MEDGRDPYLRHLYRVNFDGSGGLSPRKTLSTDPFYAQRQVFHRQVFQVDLAPVTVLQTTVHLSWNSSERHRTLASNRVAFPGEFTVKARDGEDDIYGMILRRQF